VPRQLLVLHNSFQTPIYAGQEQKTNLGEAAFDFNLGVFFLSQCLAVNIVPADAVLAEMEQKAADCEERSGRASEPAATLL